MTDEPAIEITLDDAYLRELHEEWVRSVGRGWRLDRAMSRVFLVAGLVTASLAAWRDRPAFLALAALLAGVTAFETWRRTRRREAWLSSQRRQDWFGRTMTIVVRDGALVQVKTFAGDPRWTRTGGLTPTPNGWLVRYVNERGERGNDAVSSTLASVYLPLRAVRPAMSRASFEERLSRR